MIHVYTSWNSLQIGKLAFVQTYPSQADKQSTQEMQQTFPYTELPWTTHMPSQVKHTLHLSKELGSQYSTFQL